MEDECSPLSWEFYQEEGLEDIRRYSLLYTTLELEATIVSAKQELTKREYELIQLNDLLSRVIKERDEAQAKCQKLMLEKLELQQELQKQKNQQLENQQILQKGDTISQTEGNSGPPAATASDCDESNNTASPGGGSTLLQAPSMQAVLDELAEKKPLPEKGKLLKAVIEAGPLLQTLLLAGPLPQWQHPPPQLNSIEIPPVTINSSSTSCLLPPDSCNIDPCFNKKRKLVLAGTDCPNTDSQGRKVILH